MNYRYIFTLLFVAIGLSIFGQHDIKINFDGYENDTLIVGFYMGDRQLVHDTLYAQKTGKFRMKADSSLHHGFYLLLTRPDNKYIQFIIDEDQKFELTADATNLADVDFKGSEDNELFTGYLDFLGTKRPEAAAINAEIDSLKEDDPKREELTKRLDAFDIDVKKKQSEIIKNHPNSFTAKLVKANLSLDIPEFEGTEKETKRQTYLFYKEHYFDNIDLSDSTLLRTSFLHERVNYYMTKLTLNHPDSISNSIDFLLEKMEPAPETYRYYLSYFLSNYAKSKIVGLDKVYVYLVDNYYAKGKAPWVPEETMVKLMDTADDLRPILIGNIGEDLTLYKQDGSTVTLSELEYEYLVLMFHAPDCGHCKKSMPDVVEFYKEYKDKGVLMVAICTKHGDKAETCWDIIEEKNMTEFINVNDKYHKSKFKTKYFVKSTPKMFILDKDRKILIKDIGGSQLGAVMEDIFKRKEQENLNQN